MKQYNQMEQRFWNKVRRGTDDECWEWLASKRYGYGVFHPTKTITAQAHRVAWELTHGKIPDGLVVRHKCRGKCVNPAHMELGTQAQNLQDMTRDATRVRGETHGRHKLTEAQVREIRTRTETQRVLAAEYGVSQQTISKIKTGKKWV